MKRPVRISITGAAGSINYNLLFKIAAGEMFGKNQPVILQLIELPSAIKQLTGVAMELEDCAFPLLHSISIHDNPIDGFTGAHYALLIGAKPRGPGMERKALLQENARIFSEQGKALNAQANQDVKVLVVGNPANTNALIASRNAPDLSPAQFTALTRLDHNRARGILSNSTGINPKEINGVIIWGNHSATQFPDLYHATYCGKAILDEIDGAWYQDEFIPKIQQRGSEIIDARGFSSAASAAQAIVDHMRDWVGGTKPGEFTSMGIVSDGSYGIAKGIYYSFPVRCDYGRYSIVKDLDISSHAREMMEISERELLEERDAVQNMLLERTQESHENLSICIRSGHTLYEENFQFNNEYLKANRVL